MKKRYFALSVRLIAIYCFPAQETRSNISPPPSFLKKWNVWYDRLPRPHRSRSSSASIRTEGDLRNLLPTGQALPIPRVTKASRTARKPRSAPSLSSTLLPRPPALGSARACSRARRARGPTGVRRVKRVLRVRRASRGGGRGVVLRLARR